ncbi:MAG: hypothetical protein GY931_11330 [Maribacter sp.]|nr:hypothetical protein [Maribacter sp.]
MGINRLFLGPFNAKVFGEEIKEKEDKTFDEVLREEHAKLTKLITEMEKKWNTENISNKSELKTKYHLPFNE